jgi:hypothetical protein
VFTSENSTPTELSPEESDIVGFGECFAREILGMVCVEGAKNNEDSSFFRRHRLFARRFVFACWSSLLLHSR